MNSTASVVTGQWNHVAVTRNASGAVTFYLNGEKVGEGSFSQPAAANDQPLVIGRRAAGGNAKTHVDEVALFDKALTEKEIAGHVAGAGTVNDGRRTIELSPGAHRLRVEYLRHPARGNLTRTDTVDLTWLQLGGFGWTVLPTGKLTPNYGLVTSTTELESRGVANKRKITSYGENLDPAFGVTERAVANPAGLAMSGTATYEDPGEGFLRRTAETMATGAQTTYTYYGDTEARDNPCTPEAAPVIQSGLSKQVSSPTAADGTTRIDEQVYDRRGRVVAQRLTSGGWACTRYDTRGRVTEQTYPANSAEGERVVTYIYAVDGDPLTTAVSDHHGTVTMIHNLLGQTVTYTDVHGVRTEKTYDAMGRVSENRVTLPGAGDGQQVTSYGYDDAGRLLTTTLEGITLATATYDNAGQLASVAYDNGTTLATVDRDLAGRRTGLTWQLADGQEVASTVTRSRAGTIVDESLGGADARPDGPNYLYDTVGRMTEAYVAGHHYSYDFTSQAGANCPEGTQANAGRNTNRVRLTDVTAAGTAVTGYCYDAADRLLATHGALETSYEYDAEGNTTAITEGDNTTYLGWDSAGRNLTARTTGPEPASVAYERDALDRIIRRGVTEGDTPGQGSTATSTTATARP